MEIQYGNRLCVAVDSTDREEILGIARDFGPYVRAIKFGKQILTALALGALSADILSIVTDCSPKGERWMFLDGKYKDIPNTVGEASRVAGASPHVGCFNVHLTNTDEALRAAVANKGGAQLLGVTVLTSMNDADCAQIYGAGQVEWRVLSLAVKAAVLGFDGVVCSPKEARMLCEDVRTRDLERWTPGISAPWAVQADQKRVQTPAEAARYSHVMIMGRGLTRPNLPGGRLEALQRADAQIAEALAARPA